MFRADELLLALTRVDARFAIIGGIAVGVHGYVRATRDLDIAPDSDPANLARLAHLLAEIDAEHVGLGDFSPEEFPFDPLDPDQLAQGANFRSTRAWGRWTLCNGSPASMLTLLTLRLHGTRSR